MRAGSRIASAAALALIVAAVACGDSEVPAGPAAPAVPSAPRPVGLEVITTNTNFFTRGQTQQMTARVTMSNGFLEDKTSGVTWQSSNGSVASVSSSGVVTAGDEGSSTISATFEGQRGTRDILVRYGFRTPDPPPGGRIPVPNEANFVASVIRSRPDLLARSCQPESGGNGTWELMDLIVDRLRAERDLRWGYNGRRGLVSDPARDEVAFHWGSGPDELSRDTYAFDVIAGHCGVNPQPTWIDQSALGTVWLSRGRF